MIIAGDCVTFDATRRRRYRARLADRLRRRGRAFIVEEGHIYLTVSCASTLVATSIVAPDASAANELKDDLAEQLLANTTLLGTSGHPKHKQVRKSDALKNECPKIWCEVGERRQK